jgi:hypothetical protein
MYNTQVDTSRDRRDQDAIESLIVLQSSRLVGQRPDKAFRMSMVISQRREEWSSKESRIGILVEVRLDN